MSDPAVVDTNVYSRVVLKRSKRTSEYDRFVAILQGRPLVFAVQTVAELRFGAIVARWGERRRQELEKQIERVTVIPVDDALASVYADLKAHCRRHGSGLGQRDHDGDRWIAATALHAGLTLVTNDRIFIDAHPNLILEPAPLS